MSNEWHKDVAGLNEWPRRLDILQFCEYSAIGAGHMGDELTPDEFPTDVKWQDIWEGAYYAGKRDAYARVADEIVGTCVDRDFPSVGMHMDEYEKGKEKSNGR